MHAFVLAYCCFIYCVDCIYSFASYKPLGAIKIMSETEDVAAADADFTPNYDLGLRGTRNNSTLTAIWRTRSSACNALGKRKFYVVKSYLKELNLNIQKRNKPIRLADKSAAGWNLVNEYLSDELASRLEDEKRIRRAE